MPETALGHARLARRADLAFCPLDSEYYPRVFKFRIDGARFRDRRIWRDRSVTQGWRRCRIASPSPWSRSTCATCAGLTAWVAWGGLVANEALGRRERVDPQVSPGKGWGLWQCFRASESALPMRIWACCTPCATLPVSRLGWHGRKRGVWATRACWPAGSACEGRGLWQCYRVSEFAFSMQI